MSHHWIDDVALLPGTQVDRIAARWIDLIDCEESAVDAEEKPMLRQLAGDLIDFCHCAEGAEDLLLAWSIQLAASLSADLRSSTGAVA